MENGSGLSASDVLALTRDNGNSFLGGSTGGILALIIIFVLLFGGGNWGNNGNIATQMSLSDINMAQYFQSQDTAIRGLGANQSAITQQVMSSNYDNALLLKDLSNQMSNSVAGISNQIANQTNTIANLFNQNTIRELSDKLQTTRDELSNTRQTSAIDSAINNSTNTILNSLGQWHAYPPCYTGCGCGNNNLY